MNHHICAKLCIRLLHIIMLNTCRDVCTSHYNYKYTLRTENTLKAQNAMVGALSNTAVSHVSC
jgi:hypothetical protein